MTDSPRPGRDEQSGFRGGDEQPQGYGYAATARVWLRRSWIQRSGVRQPGALRPHLSGTPPDPRPTERLPPYGDSGYDPYATGQYGPPSTAPASHRQPPPPEEPKSPRWLWIVAGDRRPPVIGLVIALVIVNSSQQQTVVAPPPTRSPTSRDATPTTTRLPTAPRTTRPCRCPRCRRSRPRPAGRTTTPGATETVVYDVSRHRPGHQHHLRRHRRTAADRVQRDAAVESRSRRCPSRPRIGQRQHHQRRPRSELLDHRQRVQVQQRTGTGLTICTAVGS